MNNDWSHQDFCKESNMALTQFFKVVESQKLNPYCDKKRYEVWKNFVKMSEPLKLNDKIEVVDLTETKEVLDKSMNVATESVALDELQSSTCEDLTASLREHLQYADEIPVHILKELQMCSSQTIKDIFCSLSTEINNQQIVLIGESIEHHFEYGIIIKYFFSCLLIKKMMTVFEEDIKLLFLRLCDTFHQEVLPTLVSSIKDNDQLDILLLYLNFIKPPLSEGVLRELLVDVEYLPKKYITVIDSLISSDVSYDCLKQLVEVMANSTEQYVADREYGKLLIRITQYLGTNLVQFETPLRHILIVHKSVWKTKLQKTFDGYFNKTVFSMESQIME